MASTTYSGVTREKFRFWPYAVASGSILVRGMVVEWNAGTQQCRPWTSGTIVPASAFARGTLITEYCL